jgi:hypothetical protein
VPGSPWDAWRGLAEREWAHTFSVGAAEELSLVQSLEEDDRGAYAWVEESVHRTHTGVYLFSRASRREGESDQRVVVLGATPEELVVAIRGQLGMPPGRLEVLGKAGIEIGLEPDDEIEGDELNGPGPDIEPRA